MPAADGAGILSGVLLCCDEFDDGEMTPVCEPSDGGEEEEELISLI
jgi:hypothetical protein